MNSHDHTYIQEISKLLGNLDYIAGFLPMLQSSDTISCYTALIISFRSGDISVASYGLQLYDILKVDPRVSLLHAGFENIGGFTAGQLMYTQIVNSKTDFVDWHWVKCNSGILNFAFVAT